MLCAFCMRGRRETYIRTVFSKLCFWQCTDREGGVGGKMYMNMFRRRTCGSPGLRCARLCVVNSNDDGTGGKGRGEVRGAESKSYIRYSTRLDSSQASVAVFLQNSLFFSAPHCALRKRESRRGSGGVRIHRYICSLPFTHVRV